MPYKNKDKQREYQREWMRKRRDEFFAGKSCEQCGSENFLELDHRDPGEKISHRIWSWRKERRELELSKCQILCYYCHQDKTADDNGYGCVRHGQLSMYTQYGCRCRECKDAARDYMRDYRKRAVAKR